MPTFDVVSEVDMHEVANSVDQANREVDTRFDFKGTGSRFEINDGVVTAYSQSNFQLDQMAQILRDKLAKRGIDTRCLDYSEAETAGKEARQRVTIRQGLDSALCKQLVKQVKESKLKVQASIQGEQVRVTGKKRDDLQQVIALLKDAEFEMPLQFTNFRD